VALAGFRIGRGIPRHAKPSPARTRLKRGDKPDTLWLFHTVSTDGGRLTSSGAVAGIIEETASMRSWKQSFVTAAFVLASLIPAGQALAQTDATPETIPLFTSPAFCSAEPANPARLVEIAGSAIDDSNAVVPEELLPMTDAEIVTGDEAGAVVALAQEFVACVNANDELRAVSLLTDEFIKRSAYDLLSEVQEADIDEVPEPLEAEDQSRIAGASDVYQFPDGRYAYIFDLGPVTGESPFARLQLIAIENDGEFKIDDLRFQDIEFDSPDCGSGEADGCIAPEDTATFISGETYSGWIMTAQQAEDAMPMFVDRDRPYFGMQVTEEQIAEAEAALPAYVQSQPRATPRLIEDLQTGVYERQYIGYSLEFQFLLVINAYCDETGGDPSHGVVMVMDGGDCFWNATYDLTQGRFISLSVNGDA
jgi:hypothetical protein